MLTGSDVDAIGGLLTLREGHAFAVYATAKTLRVLDDNPVFEVLDRRLVARRGLALDEEVALTGAAGEEGGQGSGLCVEAFAVPGKVPLYLEQPGQTPPIIEGEETVGLAVSDGRSRMFFVPGCAAMTEGLRARLRNAAVVLFDGTLWTDDEMISGGLGAKTGRRMGHMSVSGPVGTMAAFDGLNVRRKVLIHINNSNPVLLADSAERAAAAAAGWEVAFDGMEIEA